MIRGLWWLFLRLPRVIGPIRTFFAFLWCIVGPWHSWTKWAVLRKRDTYDIWGRHCSRCGWDQEEYGVKPLKNKRPLPGPPPSSINPFT